VFATRPLAAAAAAFAVAAPAQAAVTVAPHRAIYDLDLVATRGQQTVADIDGQMMFQWGDSCDGWTVEQRYRMTLLYANGPQVDRSSVYATWESKDGRQFNYNLRTTTDGEPESEIRGTATLDGAGGGTATFKLPEEATETLPAGTIFPTAHTLRLLESMQTEQQFFTVTLFDGTERDSLQFLSTVIGRTIEPAAGPDVDPLLSGPSRPVNLAFFTIADGSEIPDYEMRMRMFENGVADDIVIDYGDFARRARLTESEARDTPTCR